MKRLIIWAIAALAVAYAIGAFFGLAVTGAPADWKATQSDGRPPRLVALLALGPILLVGVVALAVRFYRRIQTHPMPRPAQSNMAINATTDSNGSRGSAET